VANAQVTNTIRTANVLIKKHDKTKILTASWPHSLFEL